MLEYKKTRSGIAVPKRAGMGAGLAGSSTSTKNDTTAAGSRQIKIADLLPTGGENAVPLRHIKKMVDLPGREIRKMIQTEREQHIPIVSDGNGYYLAKTEQEKNRFVRGMKRRAAEIVRVAESVEVAEIGGE